MAMKVLLGLWITLVITAALLFPIIQSPTAWYEFPLVTALGDNARILFFHVPMAWVSVVAFVLSMVYGIRFLAKRDSLNDVRSSSAAGLGLLFCVLATVTGSLWARFSWGSFWNWDPRQTSIVILLLIYGAYFSLRSSIDSDEKRAAISAAYSIFAGVTAPFFVFILPRIVSGLHPDPIINTQGTIHMNRVMLTVFLASLAGFTALFFWMLNLKVRLTQCFIHNNSGER